MNWFEVKMSYEKTMENGRVKKVTEPYLVDALSHTEAEARGIEEIKPYIDGAFTVATVRRAKINELFFNASGDRWYKAKVVFITLDERSGAERRCPVAMYAQASDLKEAIAVVEEGMKGTMADYQIVGVNETMVMDVFPFVEKKKEGGE